MADAGLARRQEPRGEAHRRAFGAHRQPADPHLVRAVCLGRSGGGHGRRGEAQSGGRPARRNARRRVRLAPRPARPASDPPAMRIITGTFKGATIEAPTGLTTRPTSDRVRQALFNVLAVSYTHLRAHETRHDLVCRLLLE